MLRSKWDRNNRVLLYFHISSYNPISMTALGFFIFCCRCIIEDWGKSPTYNTMEMKCIDDPSTLPAVSICNDNAFRKSKIVELNLTDFEDNDELHDALSQLKGDASSYLTQREPA